MRRGRGDKRKNDKKPKHAITELPTEDAVASGETTADEKEQTVPPTSVTDKPKRPIVVKPIGVIQ